MKTLYLDCQMGAAGDMLSAALIELFPEPEKILEKLNGLGLEDIRFTMSPLVKCGIRGTHVSVKIHGVEETPDMYEHHHEQHSHEDSHIHDHPYDHHDHEAHPHDHHGHEEDHSHPHHSHMDDHEGHPHDHEAHPHDHHAHAEDHPHDHHEHEAHSHDHDAHAEDHPHDHHHDHHDHHHPHVHHGLADIEHIVRDHLSLPDSVREDVLHVFGLIAEAESHVHGVPVTDIHFHEVGTMDAVADVTAVCYLIHELAPEQVVVSPVCTGFGQIKCAHGLLPVPAPATAFLLQGIPTYGGEIRGELCTPTGAAILKYFASHFGSMPVMKTQAIGYGMGTRDYPAANCVRAMLGETTGQTDTVTELACNVDDMTAEEIGYAMDKLFAAGALDVFTVLAGMKKNRPGTLIRVLCRPSDKNAIVEQIFRHTTTIGIRESNMNRYVLKREIRQLQTPYGEVRCKESSGYGVKRRKYEYDDISRLADEQGCSLQEILSALDKGIYNETE